MEPQIEYVLVCFDLLLVAVLLWLAWQLLCSDGIFKAVILFISFGLLMSLAWARLQGPDVAMAEMAIGAGLTGPLFLAALRRIERPYKQERRVDMDEEREDG
ncbi:MAG: Na(+)/H(+) antiporter subunit B [Desulfurivibrionaceae bacterium]